MSGARHYSSGWEYEVVEAIELDSESDRGALRAIQ